MNVKLLTTDLTNVMDLLDDAFADAWELRMAVAFMTAPGTARTSSRSSAASDGKTRARKRSMTSSWRTRLRDLLCRAARSCRRASSAALKANGVA
jgi:hypothetical protein